MKTKLKKLTEAQANKVKALVEWMKERDEIHKGGNQALINKTPYLEDKLVRILEK